MIILINIFHSFFFGKVLKEWSDFYKSSFPSPTLFNLSFSENEQQIAKNINEFWVCSCFFNKITSTSNGGAIQINLDDGSSLIEFSTFSQCSITGDRLLGGAIHIAYLNSVLFHVCGYNCSSSCDEGFSNIHSILNNNKMLNSAIECSIAHCKSDNDITMYHKSGTA